MPRRRPRPDFVFSENCPACGRRVPTDHRYNPFCELYGHRCPHGCPCPSFAPPPRGAHDCATCYQATRTQLLGEADLSLSPGGAVLLSPPIKLRSA